MFILKVLLIVITQTGKKLQKYQRTALFNIAFLVISFLCWFVNIFSLLWHSKQIRNLFRKVWSMFWSIFEVLVYAMPSKIFGRTRSSASEEKSGKCTQHSLLIYSKLSNTSHIISFSECSWFINFQVNDCFFWIKMIYATDQGVTFSIDKIGNWCRSLLFNKLIVFLKNYCIGFERNW